MAWWGLWEVDLRWQGKHGDMEGRWSEEVLVPEGLKAEDELIKETMQRPQGFSGICPDRAQGGRGQWEGIKWHERAKGGRVRGTLGCSRRKAVAGLEAILPLGSKGLGWAPLLEWASDSRQWEQSPAPQGQRLRSARGQASALDLVRGR